MFFKKVFSYYRAVSRNDPAARSRLEVMLCYSGLHALVVHSVCHALWRYSSMKLCARVLSQINRFITGIEIHPGAQIGRGVFIDHGMGIVIGETAIVGDDVVLFHGVTLGGTGKDMGKRHPTIEAGVYIGTHATLLGPITVGARTKIGAGALILHDVPSDVTVVGVPPAQRIMSKNTLQ